MWVLYLINEENHGDSGVREVTVILWWSHHGSVNFTDKIRDESGKLSTTGCHLWYQWNWRYNCIACKWLTLKHNLTSPNLTFKPTTYHPKIYHLQPLNLLHTTYKPSTYNLHLPLTNLQPTDHSVTVTPAPPIPQLPPKLAIFRTLPRNPDFQGYLWYFQQFLYPLSATQLVWQNNKPAWNCKTLPGNKLIWPRRPKPQYRIGTNKRTSVVPCSGVRLQKLTHAYKPRTSQWLNEKFRGATRGSWGALANHMEDATK